MRFLCLSLSSFLLLIFSVAVQAQEIYQCGLPDDHPGIEKTDDPEFWRYCDIYSRRFAYIEEQKDFRADLDARRRNYVDYRARAVENYKDELELYYLLID